MGTRNLAGAINPKILRAAQEFSQELRKRGIPHAIIGGLAVGAHGYPRATRDADFLIARSAMTEVAGAALGGEVSGKTLRFHGVIVDLLFAGADEGFLEDEIARAQPAPRARIGQTPVVSVEALVCMKLDAARAKDTADVVELIKRGGVRRDRAHAFLRAHRPDLVDDFRSCAAQAAVEAE